jgi:hypothetical protein
MLVATAGWSQDIPAKAKTFLSSLSPELRSRAQFTMDDAERFSWHFVPMERKGPTFRDFNEAQTAAAKDLLKASLSEMGYQKATAITQLENILKVIENRAAEDHHRDPLNYHFSFFGTPSTDKAWGWRFEGHHISINFALIGNRMVSSTPSFFGTNPGIVLSGPEKDKQVLKQEAELGFALLNALTNEQRKTAVFSVTAPAEIITVTNREVENLKPDGISFSALTEDQKKIFTKLLNIYVSNYQFDFSETLMKKITQTGMDKLSFGWAGSLVPGAGHYYRIQGPTLLIEYDNTQNNANHAHTVVRDLTNDFAKDILKEHYQQEHKSAAH